MLHQAHHLRLLVKGDSLFCSEGANDDGRRGPAMEPTGRGWTRSRAKAGVMPNVLSNCSELQVR